MIDLDPDGPHYPGPRSLADLVDEGVRRSDLTPRSGVAVLRNGGVGLAAAAPVVEAMLAAHPCVVLRLPPRPRPGPGPVAVVPVRLALPGSLFPPYPGPAVWQAVPVAAPLPGEGVRLPVPPPATVAALLRGRQPVGRDRWIGAWSAAWRFPWER